MEAEDTRELSREVVGVGRRKELIERETNRKREKDGKRGRTARERSVTIAVFAISSHPVIRVPVSLYWWLLA